MYVLDTLNYRWSPRRPCKLAGLHELQVDYNFSVSCNSHGVAVKVDLFEIDEMVLYEQGINIMEQRRRMIEFIPYILGSEVQPVSDRKANCLRFRPTVGVH